MSAIVKLITGTFKFILKAVWWIVKGFLNPFGFILRALLIGGIIAGLIFLF